MSHGYLPWQFLSPLYNHRTDRWGGSYENRLRFPLEAMTRIRAAIGDEPFLGYRINSTSFWPGDLELEDMQRIVADLEASADVDYVNLSAGVHHSYIHTPMTYEDGWERELHARGEDGLVEAGAARRPDHAARGRRGAARRRRRATRSCSRGSCSPTPSGRAKAREGRADDIRRCVAANYCWRSVIRGGRVQCVYNPEVGREARLGRGHARPGGGRGSACSSSAPGRPGSSTRGSRRRAGTRSSCSSARRGRRPRALVRRCCRAGAFGGIAHWLGAQAHGNGAEIRIDAE